MDALFKKFWWMVPLCTVVDICAYMFILWCNMNIGNTIEPGGPADLVLMSFWVRFCLVYIPVKIFVAFPAMSLLWKWKIRGEE